MDNTWCTDDLGISRFRHAGWTLTKYPSSPDIRIDAPSEHIDVEMDADGISCFGEERNDGWESAEAIRFTIPWRIIEEMCKVRAGNGKVEP